MMQPVFTYYGRRRQVEKMPGVVIHWVILISLVKFRIYLIFLFWEAKQQKLTTGCSLLWFL